MGPHPPAPEEASPAAAAETLDVHASCVRFLDRGVLIEGPAGSGKSDLALRLIDAGGGLVADDVMRLRRRQNRLLATAIGEPGLIELRGHGIFRIDFEGETEIAVCVRLDPRHLEDRLPEPASRTLLGVGLPLMRLDPAMSSAVARLRVVLTTDRVA